MLSLKITVSISLLLLMVWHGYQMFVSLRQDDPPECEVELYNISAGNGLVSCVWIMLAFTGSLMSIFSRDGYYATAVLLALYVGCQIWWIGEALLLYSNLDNLHCLKEGDSQYRYLWRLNIWSMTIDTVATSFIICSLVCYYFLCRRAKNSDTVLV